jgi:arylsulfatase A-like enzyme
MGKPMNVIYIVCHDLGRMLGCYGRPFASPYLDRFSAEGVRFTNAFCQSPACSPSRGCALTGRPAHMNGLMGLVNGGWSLPIEERTFIDAFSDAGYHTVLCGLDHTVRYRSDLRFHQDICRSVHTEQVVDAAIAFLEARHDTAKPFLMHIGTHEVHAAQWQKRFPPRDAKGKNPTLRKYAWIDEATTPLLDTFAFDTPAVRAEAARFGGCLAYHDYHLGRLFGAIDLLDLRDRTMVVFTTDHGVPGLRAKGTLYDMGVETALVMRGPGLPPGAIVDDLVSNIDLAPSMMEAAGVPVPETVLGQSVMERATTGRGDPREELFTERNYHGGMAELREDGTSANYDPIRSVRTTRHHLIRNFDADARRDWTPDDIPYVKDTYPMWFNQMAAPATEPRPKIELYDVQTDPQERHNIADDPGVVDVRRDLETRLERWMQETDDPLLHGPIPDRYSPWPDMPEERGDPDRS